MAKPTVDALEAKGWTRLDLNAGEVKEVAYDPAAQDLVLRGQRFDADGKMLKGKNRPKISANETDTGCSVAASAAATVLYKLVDQKDDDEADEAPSAA